MERKYERHTIQTNLLEPLPSWNQVYYPDYGPSLSSLTRRILSKLLQGLVWLASLCGLYFLILYLLNYVTPG